MLNEQDLIRLVIQSPKYLQKLLKQDLLQSQPSNKIEVDKKSRTITLNSKLDPQDQQSYTKPQSLTKEQSKELTSIIYSVYSGMSKYIQSQTDKGRVVEFPLLGKFACKNASDSDKEYIFLPNLDFISSGKFSYPENDCNIPPFSKRAPTFQANSLVSLSAISSVSSLDRDLVANILKDIFVKFIECNRQGHEVKIDLRIGYLHALPNGEVQFENKSADDGIAVHDQAKYVKRQMKENADIDIQLKQFQSGGGSFGQSMKSAFMSVKTPYTHGTRTQASRKSNSIANQNKFANSSYNWRSAFQSGSKAQQSNYDVYSQFSKNSKLGRPGSQAQFRSSSMGGHNASPFDNGMLPQLNQNKGATLSQSKMSEYSDTRSQVLEKMAQNEYIPIETFDQFVMKKMGTRPGKRIFFQNNDAGEEKQKILQSYLQDMKVKQMDKLEQKKQKLADEVKEIEENNKKLNEMKIKEKNKKFQKEAQFRQQVEEVKKERQMNDKMDQEYRRAGLDDNYFPFTHGDQVEIHRQQMKQEMTNQLKEFQEREKQAFQQKESLGGTRNELNLGDSKHNTNPEIRSQAESQSVILHQGKERSENLRLKLQEANPFFLKRHENIRVKQTDPQLYDDAMEKARIRYEAQLQKQKEDHENFNKQHKTQFEDNIKYSEALKLQKLKKVKEHQLLIQQQIDEKKMIKDHEQVARREKYQTTWGPEENEKTVQMELLKKEFYRETLSKDLQDQINLQKMATNEQKHVDGILDKQHIEQALNFEKEEILHSQNIKNQNRELLKNAWEDQIKLKEDISADKFSKQAQIIMTK